VNPDPEQIRELFQQNGLERHNLHKESPRAAVNRRTPNSLRATSISSQAWNAGSIIGSYSQECQRRSSTQAEGRGYGVASQESDAVDEWVAAGTSGGYHPAQAGSMSRLVGLRIIRRL
jgi:hypothetical protein